MSIKLEDGDRVGIGMTMGNLEEVLDETEALLIKSLEEAETAETIDVIPDLSTKSQLDVHYQETNKPLEVDCRVVSVPKNNELFFDEGVEYKAYYGYIASGRLSDAACVVVKSLKDGEGVKLTNGSVIARNNGFLCEVKKMDPSYIPFPTTQEFEKLQEKVKEDALKDDAPLFSKSLGTDRCVDDLFVKDIKGLPTHRERLKALITVLSLIKEIGARELEGLEAYFYSVDRLGFLDPDDRDDLTKLELLVFDLKYEFDKINTTYTEQKSKRLFQKIKDIGDASCLVTKENIADLKSLVEVSGRLLAIKNKE